MSDTLTARPRAGRYFLLAGVGLGAIVALCAWAGGAYMTANIAIDHTLDVRRGVYEWLVALLDAETGARGYIASDQAVFLEPYLSALARERTEAAHVRALVAGDPAQADRIAHADAAAQAAMAQLRELVGLEQAGHRSEALVQLTAGEGKHRMDAFRAIADDVRATEERVRVDRRSAARWWAVLVLLGASLLPLASAGALTLAWLRERAHRQAVAALATGSRRRLEALSALAAALSEARSRSQVAAVIVEHGLRAAGAATLTLYQLDEAGTTLELIGERGVVPEVLDRVRRMSAASVGPATFAAMISGPATWVENEAEYAAVRPDLAAIKTDGPRAKAFWSAPLIAEAGPLGLLGVGFHEPRRFSAEERDFVRTLANHCAQALLRASRLEREDEARRWLGTTLRSIGDAVIATDAAGHVTFMNPVAETLTGWPEAEARGRPLDDVFCIFAEETRAPVENPVTKVLREGMIVGLANHTVLRLKRGYDIPIDDSGAPIRHDDGRILGVVLVFRDVTREKRDRARSEFLARAGEALVSSIDYQSTLATVARFAVPALADWCAVDLVEPGAKAPRQVAVAHVDENKLRLARELGERYPPDRDAPRGVPEVIRTGKPELYAEIPQALLEAAARDDEHRRMIRELDLRSAMVVPLRVRGRTLGAMTFVYAESGRRYEPDDLAFAEDFARRAAMAIENALALKEAEEARADERQLRGEAELANRSKDEFLATVSHELRTPLNAILGWTVTLRGRKLADDVDRALAIVERNARLQTKLIEDVLDVSRIISGKLALNVGATNVAETIAAAIETVTQAAEAKEIAIFSDVPDQELTITADADRLQQIAWNLLSNAVKFTPKRGRVTVRAHRSGSDVCLSVSDSGEGIRRDVLPVIFEPFQQADASTTRRHGGLGLGLAIVRQLVSAHGGTVEAESEGAGKGATFTVHLPARSAVPAVARGTRVTAGLPTASASASAAIGDAPRLDGLRLLVVDDEQDALGLVSQVLRERGAEVHVAASVREALARFESVRPDVVVSDIGMPEEDGFSLIRKIRALAPDEGGRTPAVALTAYARAEDAQRAFAAGFQMHVAKPVEPAKLATVVANLGGRIVDGG